MSLVFRRIFLWVLILGGVVALVLCLRVVSGHLGAEAAGASVFAAPIVVLAVPWWAAFADNDWLPLIVVYGWLAVCGILYVVSENLKTLDH